MQDHIVHIDAQPDIATLLELIKAVMNVPAHATDPTEKSHLRVASELLQKIRPDAILLNINVPGLDSEKIVLRAGSSSTLHGIVQLLTRELHPELHDQAKSREGVDTYITQKVENLVSR